MYASEWSNYGIFQIEPHAKTLSIQVDTVYVFVWILQSGLMAIFALISQTKNKDHLTPFLDDKAAKMKLF